MFAMNLYTLSVFLKEQLDLSGLAVRDPFAFRVMLAPKIFLRTQDSAPKVNLKFHKCEKGLLCPFVKYHRFN